MEQNILKISNWGQTWSRSMGKSGLTWAVENETADLLYGFVRMTKPVKILEIGTFEGVSSIAMGMALKQNGKGKNLDS